MIGELDTSFQVVALIDADVIPHGNWLQDLVQPFHDARVGATTGVRWYKPLNANWGSLVRSLWNAAAVSQMYAFCIPWGGSMAFRAELFRDTDLLECWKHSFCEDTPSYKVLRRLGLRLGFVPAATMVNPERIDLKPCFSFIRRQLFTTRLHHPRWPLIRAFGVGSGLTLLLTAGMLLASVLVGDWFGIALLGGALTLFVFGLASALLWMDFALQQTAHRRGESFPPTIPFWKLALAGMLTQGVYMAALVSVSFLRKN